MTVKSGQAITVLFATSNATTGAAEDATVGPAGTLYVDGVPNAAAVTVTNLVTGVYKAALTLPALTAGQVASLRIAATVAAVAGEGIVWQDVSDTAIVSDAQAILSNVTYGNSALATLISDVPTAAENADAVLDEAKGAHSGLLAGVALDSTVAKEATLTHATYGLDKIKTDTAAILVDTGTDGVKLADNALTDAKMDTTALQAFRDAMKRAATSGTPTTGSIDKHLDDILADTAEIGTAGAGLTAIPDTAGTTTLLGILSGITSLPKWLRGLFRKDAMDATAKSEVNLGGGTFGEETDSLEAQADNVPTGAFSKVYTVTVGGVAAAGAYCRLCTDAACTVSVSAGTTNSLGQVTFWHNLPVGTAVWVHVVLSGNEPLIDAETI